MGDRSPCVSFERPYWCLVDFISVLESALFNMELRIFKDVARDSCSRAENGLYENALPAAGWNAWT